MLPPVTAAGHRGRSLPPVADISLFGGFGAVARAAGLASHSAGRSIPRDRKGQAEIMKCPVGSSCTKACCAVYIAESVRRPYCELEAPVGEGRFRDDLYYRLAGAHLKLPPLRERRDLPWLVQKMLREGSPAVALSGEAEAVLRAHAWPGNLRELRNVVEFARAVCSGGVIEVGDFPDALAAAALPLPAVAQSPGSGVAHLPEAQLLLQYLRAAQWNVSAVAHQMGLSRMTQYRRM